MDLKDKLHVVALVPVLIACAIAVMVVAYLLVPLAVVSVFSIVAYIIVRLNNERNL